MASTGKKIYISGPMRGCKNSNDIAFLEAEKKLGRAGFWPLNPCRNGHDATREKLMHDDLSLVMLADLVAVLPGWEDSPGAKVEVAVARSIGLPVVDSETLNPVRDMPLVIPSESQYRDKIPLVGLMGYAQSGKDTVANLMVENGWKKVAFADALRAMMRGLNPLLDAGVHYLDALQQHGYGETKRRYPEARVLLQRLGTEAGRAIKPDLWVEIVEDVIDESSPTPCVISDVRFSNEAKMIRRRGGFLCWVDREGIGPANDHPSENTLTREDAHRTIENNGTIDDLRWRVEDDILDAHILDAHLFRLTL